jgi:DNA-binding IclR family transcriptional regulator
MVLEGNGVRFVAGVDGPKALRVGSRTGMLLPAHTTSGGKALLTELTAEQLHALYPRGLPRAETAATTDYAQLRRELAVVRRQGYALNMEESEPGVSAVGACVRDSASLPVAALAIAAPASRSPPPPPRGARRTRCRHDSAHQHGTLTRIRDSGDMTERHR